MNARAIGYLLAIAAVWAAAIPGAAADPPALPTAVPLSSPSPVATATSDPTTGVAYDEITQVSLPFAGITATPAPPGTFAAMLSGFSGERSADTAFPPAGGQGFSAGGDAARLAHGILYHESFLGDLHRVDDPATLRSTISRPDKDEVIYLDLRAKTYRTISGDAATAILDPPPLQDVLKIATPDPASAPSKGTAASRNTIEFRRTVKSVAGVPIDGISTHGIEVDVSMTSAASECLPGSTTLTMVEYVDPNRAQRSEHYDFSILASAQKLLTSIHCRIDAGQPATSAPLPDQTRFVLYSRAENSTTIPSLPMPISSTIIVARGNVNTLSAADAGLFEIPPGFVPAAPGPAATQEGAPLATSEPSPR